MIYVYNYALLCYKYKKAEDLKVGDIIMVQQDEEVPADILLISSLVDRIKVDTALVNGSFELE